MFRYNFSRKNFSIAYIFFGAEHRMNILPLVNRKQSVSYVCVNFSLFFTIKIYLEIIPFLPNTPYVYIFLLLVYMFFS